MALDPSIILAGRPANLADAVLKGAQTADFIQSAPIIRQARELQNQQMQGQNQQVSRQNRVEQLGEFSALYESIKPSVQKGDYASATAIIAKSPLLDDEQRKTLVREMISSPETFMQQGDGLVSQFNAMQSSTGQANAQFGSSVTVKDEAGNLFTQTQRRNPRTGEVESVVTPLSGDVSPQGRLAIVSSTGETPSERISRTRDEEQFKQEGTRQTEAIKLAVKKGGEAFDRIEPIQASIVNYDDAIAALDSGAQTGVIASKFPSIKESSIKLDNVVKRLGLDVIGNTTFGALSEKELAFAVSAAIPQNLSPAELKEWLKAKKVAQQKVLERVQEAASFLSSGEKTVTDWIEYNKAREFNAQSQPSTPKASYFYNPKTRQIEPK